MTKPIIAIKLKPRNYAGLANLASRVHTNMTANANFTTPLPTLSALQTATTDVLAAIGVWGPKGNRGSHEDLVDLRTKALTLSQTLKSLAQYVQNTAQTTAGSDYELMTAIIISSGFQLANAKTPQGILQMVQNLHVFVSRKVNSNQVKLKWKKPLNTTAAGNVKSYTVYKGVQPPVFSTAAVFASIAQTSFTDTNNTGDAQTWAYWVVPVGAAGNGIVSDVVVVTVPSN